MSLRDDMKHNQNTSVRPSFNTKVKNWLRRTAPKESPPANGKQPFDVPQAKSKAIKQLREVELRITYGTLTPQRVKDLEDSLNAMRDIMCGKWDDRERVCE
ncbi:Nn.00g043300.m01.CDS01 [Neocucurbitaria sp. VM-36]